MTVSSGAGTAEELLRQREVVSEVFQGHGFRLCETDVLQPADPFLELSGEDLRRRTYVFTDAYSREVCLRPDLTIPTCLHYLNGSSADASTPTRLSYHGLAFRCQKPGVQKPNEFLQHGIELFGVADAVSADVEVLKVTLEACRAAGLDKVELKVGDLSLFSDLVAALDIPLQWQERLKRSFWKSSDFARRINALASDESQSSGVLRVIRSLSKEDAERTVADLLDLKKAEPVGGRTVEEITERLRAKAIDAETPPMALATVETIEDFLAISGSPEKALSEINALFDRVTNVVPKSLENLERRLASLADLGLAEQDVHFATEFGRNLEYYTGFVFEVSCPALSVDSQVAGGGRYDNLLKALGSPEPIPAVGAMVRADRLAEACRREEGGNG